MYFEHYIARSLIQSFDMWRYVRGPFDVFSDLYCYQGLGECIENTTPAKVKHFSYKRVLRNDVQLNKDGSSDGFESKRIVIKRTQKRRQLAVRPEKVQMKKRCVNDEAMLTKKRRATI